MSIRVVSYYTPDTIYEEIMFTYLLPCLAFFKIPNFIFSIKDTGKWNKNVLMQPRIIWEAMKTFPNDNIVWMDADVIIRGEPLLFSHIPDRCDIGLNYMRYEEHYCEGVPPGVEMPRPMLTTSVMYFKNSPKMLAFVEEWMVESAKVNVNHRVALEKLVDKHLNDSLSFFMLPRSYAYLVEREDGELPAIPMEDPIICHFEASKFAKRDLYDAKPFLEKENEDDSSK